MIKVGALAKLWLDIEAHLPTTKMICEAARSPPCSNEEAASRAHEMHVCPTELGRARIAALSDARSDVRLERVVATVLKVMMPMRGEAEVVVDSAYCSTASSIRFESSAWLSLIALLACTTIATSAFAEHLEG